MRAIAEMRVSLLSRMMSFFLRRYIIVLIFTASYIFIDGFGNVEDATCVLITDAATGTGRTISLHLVDAGFHVLAGVKSEAEKRSFAFETRKGLEPILFDLTDPASVANTVYRIKQIRTELGRTFYGTVLNLADTMREMTMPVGDAELVDVDAFDATYRAIVRSSVRLLQATVMLLSDPLVSRVSGGEGSGGEGGRGGIGGRVVTLVSERFQHHYPGCGTRCTHQSTLTTLLAQMRAEYGPRQISCSVVVLSDGARGEVGSGTRKALVDGAVHQPLQWEIDLSGDAGRGVESGSGSGSGSGLEHLSVDARAVVHALLSPRPLPHYPEPVAGSSTDSSSKGAPGTGGGAGTGTSTASSSSKSSSSGSGDSRDSALVYVRVYNPVRTYLKRLLKDSFQVPFGDEDADAECITDSAVRYDQDYVHPSTQGKKRCATVGVEYFTVRAPEGYVRWVVDEVVPDDVRKYLFTQGIVEVEQV